MPELPEVEALAAHLRTHAVGRAITRVVLIDVADRQKLFDRVTGRWSCPADGSVYHVRTSPPKVAGKCDKDGTALVQRPDDTPEKLTKRLGEYEQAKAAVVHYRERDLVTELEGTGRSSAPIQAGGRDA